MIELVVAFSGIALIFAFLHGREENESLKLLFFFLGLFTIVSLLFMLFMTTTTTESLTYDENDVYTGRIVTTLTLPSNIQDFSLNFSQIILIITIFFLLTLSFFYLIYNSIRSIWDRRNKKLYEI